MEAKWRIASILGFAILHGVVAYLSFLSTIPIVSRHFDSVGPFTFQDNIQVKITFLLLSPYYLILYIDPFFFPRSPFLHDVLIIANSLLWGIFLFWALGKIRDWMALRSGSGPDGGEG